MHDGKRVILYIDDDQDYLDAVRDFLEPEGYAMIEAHSAEDGVKAYRETKPDLILVDLMMEEVDAGTSLVKELKILGNTAPIYMLSSVGDTLNLNTDFAALGLDGVFQKPLGRDSLLAVLRARFTTPVTGPKGE